MPRVFPVAFGLTSILAFAACTASGIDMNAAANAPPRYKANPAPKEAYRITMTIKDAPGPFAQMLGLAQFDVVNRDCLPPPDDNNGHLWPIPTEGVEIPLEKMPDGSYSGIVHADHMLDEDYFGRGVCQWGLIQAQVQLKATGAKAETKFIPSINADKIVSGGVETIYMSRGVYPAAEELEDYPTFGETDRNKFFLGDEDLFSITLKARREAP